MCSTLAAAVDGVRRIADTLRMPLSNANADPWLRDLPPEVTALLASMSLRKRLRHGELLYARGAEADGLYGVVSGRIRISLTHADGREVLLTWFEPGSWFGEVSMFDASPRPQDAHAVGDTEVMLLPRAKFMALLDQHHELYRAFAKLLCRRLRMSLDFVEDMMTLPLSARLAKRLLELAGVYGSATQGAGVAIDLHLPQEDLARMIGATRQSVSKELNAWEARGLIRVEYSRITLLDSERVRALTAGSKT